MNTSTRRSLAVVGCFLAAAMASVFAAGAQTLRSSVASEAIADSEIEQRARLNFLITHRQSARQDVFKELSDEKKEIKKTEKFGVDPTDDEVDSGYAYLSSRMRITPEQLTRSLESQGIRVDTIKQRIKADMARKALIRLRYKYS